MVAFQNQLYAKKPLVGLCNRIAICVEPARDEGMLYVADNDPPEPVLVLPAFIPLTPLVPIEPIKTVNLSLAGKLTPDMDTVLSLTTAVIENVGNPLFPTGVGVVDGGVAGVGVGVGVVVVVGETLAVVFQNQL